MPKIEKKNIINNQTLQVNKTMPNNIIDIIVRRLEFLKLLREKWVRECLVEHHEYTLCILIILITSL